MLSRDRKRTEAGGELRRDPTEPVAIRPLAIQKDGAWYTYGLDLPKNITKVYGTIKTAYTYTPYGQVTASGSTVQPIQWSSEYADTDLALVYYNYRHYNPLDGRWCGRDPIGSRGGWHAYSYVSNHVYYAYDHVGLYEPFNEKSITIVFSNGYRHDEPGWLGSTTIDFPKPGPTTSNRKIIKNGNAQKYCTDFPDASYTPTITYYLAKERKVEGKTIKLENVGPEAQISKENNVEQHEMHHVEITSKYWDAFVAKSKGMEGCYCSSECMTYALIVVRESYKLNQALANRDNATFDLKEYGGGMHLPLI